MTRALCVLFLLLALTIQAEPLTGRVVGVADGDTLTVLAAGNQQIKVRLAGIDAPERNQPFGQRSRQSLSDLAFGKPATVMRDKTNRYGRTVGTVMVGAVNVEAEQVRRGLAWVYRQYSDDPQLLALEAEAKAARRGLWADANPIPPWDWRHGEKARKSTAQPATMTDSTNVAGRCGAKRTCGQRSSCEEARFYLTQCGLSALDRDKDGTPCEALCQ